MMRVLDKKLIFSVLIGIFAFYILFIFINNNQEVVDSRNLVCSENIDIENIINENENIIYSNSEISIFPNLANILCFNKIKTFT